MSKYFSGAQETRALAEGYNQHDLDIAFETGECPRCSSGLIFAKEEEPFCKECGFLNLSNEDE